MNGLQRDQFARPESAYRPAPLWVWNDDISKENIVLQLEELKKHGFGGAFVHPRPGLVTEYLSEEWFALWQYALDAAIKLELKLYIYDENSYPSGFAGGHVPSRLPDCLANAVIMMQLDRRALAEQMNVDSPMLNRPGHPIRAYACEETEAGGGELVLKQELTLLPPASWHQYGDHFLLFELGTPETNSWIGGFAYTDMMRPEVTEVFLETTYEAYKSRFGSHFGNAIPAIFTDEPEVSPGNLFQSGGHFLPFSYWFAAEFEQRNGYDLKDYLFCLFMDVEENAVAIDPIKVRFDYYSTIRELWVNNSVRPISEWCERHGIAYTGHYLEHQWPYPWGRTSPSVMSLYEYMHWPAIDMLMTHLLKKDGIEPLLMLTIREAASAANQFRRQRVLCEAYGAGGWDSTFEDYKRIGDWLYVHGINFLNQHLTFSTIVGARKRDHPQSFDWRQPWWEEYTEINDYFARLSYALSEGETNNRILLLNPTTSFYLNTPDSAAPDRTFGSEGVFEDELLLAQWLCDRLWDYDMGDEYIIERHAYIAGSQFVVGACKYDAVIIPGSMSHLKSSTFDKLEQYLAAGGQVISMREVISRLDGRIDERAGRLNLYPNWHNVTDVQGLETELQKHLAPRLQLVPYSPLPQGIAHLRRVQQDGSCLYFMVNSSAKEVHSAILVEGAYAELWDPWSGDTKPASYERVGHQLRISIHLPASGSLLIRISGESEELGMPRKPEGSREGNVSPKSVSATKPMDIAADQENTFIIDYCDLRIGSNDYRNMNTLFAGIKVFEKHGFETNPWDNGVQFQRRLVDRNRFFAENSGFEAVYYFDIKAGELPGSLKLLVERAEHYSISVNGRSVQSSRSGFLDHHMGEIDIVSHVQEGQNSVTLSANPFQVYHELEAIYLQGDFGVHNSDNKWVLGKRQKLSLGSWVSQGYPFYSGAVVYKKTIDIPADFSRAVIQLSQWEGTVATVFVRGHKAGLIGVEAGYMLDITSSVQPGENEISVRLCGSFKNLLGPHHDPDLPRKLAWPGNWKKAPVYGTPPADQYDLIHYGLLEDFVVMVE